MALFSKDEGFAPAFLNCGGIGQPPLVVKWRGRWWRTDSESPPAESNLPKASPDVLAFAKSLGPLPHGMVQFQCYRERTGKRFEDVPLLVPPQ